MKNLLIPAILLMTNPLINGAPDNPVDLSKLPLYDEQKVSLKTDWLLDNSGAKADLYRTDTGSIVLSNGLISRRFHSGPNLGCVSFKNLWSGEEFIRSPEPEATITINGMPIKVGGLLPVKQKGFILEKDIPAMKAIKGAFKLDQISQGKIKARIPWKANEKWMSEHKDWPPKGIEVSFRYKLDDAGIAELLKSTRNVATTSTILHTSDFTGATLDSGWKEAPSPSMPESRFTNEGHAGEYVGYQNESAYIERAIPKGAETIECRINPGTDHSGQGYDKNQAGNGLGPGVTLLWKGAGADQTVAKIYYYPGEGRIFGGINGDYKLIAELEKRTPINLRAQFKGKNLSCSYSVDGVTWMKTKMKVAIPNKKPDLARVGKTSLTGGIEKAAKPSKKVLSFIDDYRVYGTRKKGETILTQLEFLKKLNVTVHYNLYDGLPVISKWISVENGSQTECTLNSYTSELLAVASENITSPGGQGWEPAKRLYIESGLFRHGSADAASPAPDAEASYAVHWKTDRSFHSQPPVSAKALTRVECSPPIGPDETLSPNEVFNSHRIWELPFDRYDQERNQLAKSQLYRTLAPWITECPLEYDITSSKEENVKKGIDQCAEAGFDLMLMSFGSGFNCENVSPANIAKYKRLEDYAKKKGITIGGYNLLASRGAGKDSCIHPVTGKTSGDHCRFGRCPCMASNWGIKYLKNVTTFYKETQMGIFTHDGSYPTDPCGADYHPGHKGYEDSVWQQRKGILELYSWMNEQGIFMRIPDWYIMHGGSKVQHNYREASWSAPREIQHMLTRRTIYDSSFHSRNNIMGWTFIPLSNYKGGGKAAAMIPLKDNIADYEYRLACTFGYGVTSMMRGPQLFDGPETKAMLKKMVGFFKKHRAILTSDILHLKRPDGRNIDYILHVNPNIDEKGMLMVYNPLAHDVTQNIRIPLYYSGIRGTASVKEQENGKTINLPLNDRNEITLSVTVKANSYTWFVLQQP